MSKKLHKATVVMFDPDATTRALRWWLAYGYWDEYCKYRSSPESIKLEKLYPQLKHANEQGLIEPMAALRTYHAEPILAYAKKKAQKVFSRVSLDGPHFPLSAGIVPALDDTGTTLGGGFAYVLMEHSQIEVRSWFPDSMQSRVATWQIRLPSQKEHDPCDLQRMLALGFFPASDRALWRNRLGALRVSENMSAGMGIITNPPIMWNKAGGVEINPFHQFAHKRSNFVLSTAR